MPTIDCRSGTSILLVSTIVVAMVIALTLAFTLEWIYIYAEKGQNPLWALIREPQVGLWTTVHPGFTFHVVQPLEGVLLISILLLYFRGLGKLNISQRS